MPKISEEKRNKRKGQILHAAFQCFVEKGYDRTTMREIFDRAKLSAGAVYLYFKSKEELMQSLANAGKWHFQKVADEFYEDEEQMRNVLKKLATLIDKEGGDAGVKLEVSLLAESLNNDTVKEILLDKLRHDIKLVSRLLDTSEINTYMDKTVLSRIIIGAIQGLSIQKMLDPSTSLQKILEGCKI